MLRWLVLGWLGASLPVALLIGLAGRDRRPAPPRATAPPAAAPPPIGGELVAVHGLLQTASVLDGGLANLRASWSAMDDEGRERLVTRLHDHAATIHHVLEGLLADAPHVAATLDALAEARPVAVPAPDAVAR